jgi:alcohol dehydrogenase
MDVKLNGIAPVNWSYPNAIRFGAGRIAEIGEACSEAGITRPLLVTDRGLMGLPILERTRRLIVEAGFGDVVFGDVDANPTDKNLANGIAAFHQGGHDGVIAFGGGSGLDVGKSIAFMAGQARPVWDFEDIGDYWRRADADAIAPIVAVPTTAGTGSEVGRASVIANAVTGVKKIIFHPRILPTVVIADPELTVGLPPAITAGAGMDAFAHCLEAYSAPTFHPMGDGIALEGMRIVNTYLLRAYRDPGNLEARGQMMAAATMGAVAFQKGLGAVHAISHGVAALFGAHHGTTNAVLLAPVLEMNRLMIEAKINRAAAYMDIAGGFDGFVARVRALNEALGLPNGLGALGVTSDRIEDLIAIALDDPSAKGNPLLLTPENLQIVIESSL